MPSAQTTRVLATWGETVPPHPAHLKLIKPFWSILCASKSTGCSPSWYHRWRKPLQLLSCSTNFLTSKISAPDPCAALFVSWSLWFYTLFYAEWHLLRGKSTHSVLSWPKKSLGIFFFTLLNLY